MERVRSAMLDLCEPLHEVFEQAEGLSRERLPELAGKIDYRWLTTHTTRGFAHYLLSEKPHGALGDWSLSGNHSQNGSLWVHNGTHAVRLLHTRDESHVPPPGLNRARRAFYRNPPLGKVVTLDGEDANHQLLMLWRIDSDGLPIFRVVRTNGEWKWGQVEKVDIDFILPETAEDLEDLEFMPAEEELELEFPAEEDDAN